MSFPAWNAVDKGNSDRGAAAYACPDVSAQVFLSYAIADQHVQLTPAASGSSVAMSLSGAVHQHLLEAGLTVFDCRQLPGVDDSEEVALSRAIEACDSLVVLLSPRSIRQTLCLQGLLFALSLNKPIVPVLIDAVEPDQLPIPLQRLPCIDLQTAAAPLAKTPAGQQLVEALTHDARYRRAHKLLLVQSLRWERQYRNPCLLLRSTCLNQYSRWLDAAHRHPRYPALRLQRLFIEACQGTPQTKTWQVHLLYGRDNLPDARQLSHLLQLHGKSTSFDHLDLLLEGHPRHHRRQAIKQAVFCGLLVAPGTLDQDALLDDLEYALSLHKPLFIVDSAKAADSTLPSVLQPYPRFHWPCLESLTAGSFGQLFRLLDHNPVEVNGRAHLRTWLP